MFACLAYAATAGCLVASPNITISKLKNPRLYRVLDEQTNWLASGVFYKPNVTTSERKYFIKIGMSSNANCSDIGERQELTLYVGQM